MKSRVFALLTVLIGEAISQSPPPSPCPQVMSYEWDGSQWTGIIYAPDPPPYGSRMRITVKMSIPALLPSTYVGRLIMAEDGNTVLRQIRNGEMIKYRIYFPLSNPIPNMVEIVFDNKQICSGSPAVGYQITTVDLDHTFTSGNSAQQNVRPNNPVYTRPDNRYSNYNAGLVPVNNYNPYPQQFDNSYNRPLPTTTTTTTPAPPVYQNPPIFTNIRHTTEISIYNSVLQSKPYCGVVGSQFTALIYGGDEIERGDWPWLVAIHKKNGNPSRGNISFKFICAGNLISNTAIITAAHCSSSKAAELIVKMGVHSLDEWGDPNVQTVKISDIIRNPNYKIGGDQNNDIAIFKLYSSVVFNKYVKPVCLWEGSIDQDLVYGSLGTVVGWGEDENRAVVTTGPRKIQVPIVSSETCRTSDKRFLDFLTSSMLCAGDRDGKIGPCRGDSGGGMFLKQNGRWTIRGVVSFTLPSDDNPCDLKQYTVYTDAAQYGSWIQQL